MFKMRGRIKVGAGMYQDFGWGKWPDAACCPLAWKDRRPDPDMVFDVEWNGGGEKGSWHCKADGFGHLKLEGDKGEYGSGSIFVYGFDNVEIEDEVQA
jgi:hypothetical protein